MAIALRLGIGIEHRPRKYDSGVEYFAKKEAPCLIPYTKSVFSKLKRSLTPCCGAAGTERRQSLPEAKHEQLLGCPSEAGVICIVMCFSRVIKVTGCKYHNQPKSKAHEIRIFTDK